MRSVSCNKRLLQSGYASLGQPLEEFGISEAQNDIPGADALTSAEQAALACGSLTPAEVVAGDTVPVCSSTPMEIVTSSLPGATVRQPYSTRLTAIGGNPPYTWKLVKGEGDLPKGIRLDHSTGVISGQTKQVGTLDFVVRLSDTKTTGKPHTRNIVTQSMSITVNP